MYLTYDDYIDYGGTLDETTFDDYCWEAQTIVDWYTFNRLQNETKYPEAVKRCMNKLIQLAQLKAEAMALGSGSGGMAYGKTTTAVGEPAIASQSNDGVSISYNIMSASEIFGILTSKEAGNMIEDTVKRYLNGVTDSLGRKLLYRGLYPYE